MQDALFTLLALAATSTVITEKPARMLLAHLGAISLLLASREISLTTWPVSYYPDYWLLLSKTAVAASALLCYRQLAQSAWLLPAAADRLIITASLLSVGLIIEPVIYPFHRETLAALSHGLLLLAFLVLLGSLGRHLRQKKPPVLALLTCVLFSTALLWPLLLNSSYLALTHPLQQEAFLALVIQALLLSGLYRHFKKTTRPHQADQLRRQFSTALRPQLHKPNPFVKIEAIPEQLLSLFKTVLPDIPALILTGKNQATVLAQTEQATAHHDTLIRSARKHLHDSQEDRRLTIRGAASQELWLFLLDADSKAPVTLVLQPPENQDRSLQWQTACDLACYARTLYRTCRQSLFWQQQASLDPLTGLLNRKGFYREASHLLRESSRKKPSDYSLLFIDLDNFKQLNDSCGHSMGDQCLVTVAAICRQSIRQQDLICRYGGEEFVVLLPDTRLTLAGKVAERIRRAVEGCPLPGSAWQCTVSIGTASANSQNASIEETLKETDKALYRAKAQGKNCIAFSPPVRATPLSLQEP